MLNIEHGMTFPVWRFLHETPRFGHVGALKSFRVNLQEALLCMGRFGKTCRFLSFKDYILYVGLIVISSIWCF